MRVQTGAKLGMLPFPVIWEEGACEYLAEKMFTPSAKGLVCRILAGKGEKS